MGSPRQLRESSALQLGAATTWKPLPAAVAATAHHPSGARLCLIWLPTVCTRKTTAATDTLAKEQGGIEVQSPRVFRPFDSISIHLYVWCGLELVPSARGIRPRNAMEPMKGSFCFSPFSIVVPGNRGPHTGRSSRSQRVDLCSACTQTADRRRRRRCDSHRCHSRSHIVTERADNLPDTNVQILRTKLQVRSARSYIFTHQNAAQSHIDSSHAPSRTYR